MAKFGSSFECLLGGGVYTGRLDGRHIYSTAAQRGGGGIVVILEIIGK